jgi:hypothetical protein
MLVLDGHESHISAEFEDYCKENNIITLCLPSHLSHLTQPLDVGCFSVLKKRYGAQIEHFIKARIMHIGKDDFFLAFKTAFLETMTKENVQGGFRGAGLIPHNPDTILSKLDVKLRTPTPSGMANRPPEYWVSKTPKTTNEALSQSIFIKGQITKHQGSSPTLIFAAVDQLLKGLQSVSHELALVQAEIRVLRDANTALSKRRRVKRARLQDGEVLTGSQVREIMTGRGLIEEGGRDEGMGEGSPKRRQTGT